MKDERGRYYYPNPAKKRVRMYVKEEEGSVWFRLWNQDDPKLWDEHGWVPWGALEKAMQMYAAGKDEPKKPFDPRAFYDLDLARQILAEH